MSRQPGLFDEYDPPVARPPLRLRPGAAYQFYRTYIGEPAARRPAKYAEYGFDWRGHEATGDWAVMAAILLGDALRGRADRERVTVLCGCPGRRPLVYAVPRRDAAARVARELAGRFLVLGHAADGLTVNCRLIGGEQLVALARAWERDGGEFLAAPRRRVWRAELSWTHLDALGERVLAVRDGELAYPTHTDHRLKGD
mgnify:CR=1 FL=1